MTEKTKKRLAITGASVIGLALVIAIGMQFTKAPSEPDTLPQPEQSSTAMSPEVQKPDVVVTPAPPSSTLGSQPVESLPPQIDLPEQKLQSDPVKPEAPEPPKAEDNTDRMPSSDKNHEFKPESSETPPTYNPETTEKKPTPPPAESKPQGGGGLPGFDNVPNAGDNQGEHLDDMYENGNKIGDMS